eukprot:12907918-Prorocentrum_lima.AAC.1
MLLVASVSRRTGRIFGSFVRPPRGVRDAARALLGSGTSSVSLVVFIGVAACPPARRASLGVRHA